MFKKEKQIRINEKELVDKVMNLLLLDEKKLIELRYFNKDKISWISIVMRLNILVDLCIRLRRDVINRILEWFN